MKIMKASHIGFCFGVKRAIKRANQLVSQVRSEDIYMLGEIIHNPQVIRDFHERGIHIVQQISQVPEHKYLITRAHGIEKSEKLFARKQNIRLIDTTCPYVHKLHQIARLLKKNDYQIIIFGDTDHPEIQSVLSYIGSNAQVIQSLAEAKKLPFKGNEKIGLLSQTTKDISLYEQVALEIMRKVEELRMYNTICKATVLRQHSARKLAEKVDLMIVVGGLNSANTTRLASICRHIGVETYHVESENQLKETWFREKKTIGITSGASTPDLVTDKVIQKIASFNSS